MRHRRGEHGLRFTFYVLRFTFYVLHFTFCILHFAFYVLLSRPAGFLWLGNATIARASAQPAWGRHQSKDRLRAAPRSGMLREQSQSVLMFEKSMPLGYRLFCRAHQGVPLIRVGLAF